MSEEKKMFTTIKTNYITPKDYLKLQEKSLIKYEYQDGKICNIFPENNHHVTIHCNLYKLLYQYLLGQDFRVYIGDRNVYIKEKNCYYYPDIFITYKKTTFNQYPQLIIELISDNTEHFDRGKKMRDYQTLETLKEYILVHTTRQKIECFRRIKNNLWTRKIYTPEHLFFEFKSINFQGDFKKLYQDVIFYN